MTRVRALVAAGVVAVVIVGVVVGTPRLLRRLTFFRIRQVEIVGTRYLDDADVVAPLHLPNSASVFDRLAPIRSAVLAIPGVLGATVERRLPGTIRITLREARPVALASAGDRLVLIDSLGRKLPFDPARAPTPLPVAPQDSATAALLGRVQTSDPDLYGTIESVRLDHGDVVCDVGGRAIRLLPNADDDVLRTLSVVEQYLETSRQPWHELDARYHTRVFVRKGAA